MTTPRAPRTARTPRPLSAAEPVRPTRRYTPSSRMVHLTPAERAARGRAARAEVPRSSHAVYEPSTTRIDPVELLERQAATRVPDLVPIRYGRMASSPFAFFRGAALLMASDLATTPSSGLRVQVCGDAHLSNFGVFASPERRLLFDVNDFDETLPGPWEWDVKRLAASLEIAGRGNGFTDAERQTVVLAATSAYRQAMRGFAEMRTLDVWYARAEVDEALQIMAAQAAKQQVERTRQAIAKARTRDHLQAFNKLVRVVDGRPQFISNPPLMVPIEELVPDGTAEQLEDVVRMALRRYRSTLTSDRRHLLEQYDFVQLARKVVGVGSVGMRAWVVLMLGRDDADPLLLQVKEAGPSVLEDYVGRSEFTNAGQRVVAGQRLMQASSDIFLGWQRLNGLDGLPRDFYVRQLHDWKGSAEVEQMVPVGMAAYGRLCGWTLARGHARSGDRIAIAAYLGAGTQFDRAIATFAVAYADQSDRDYAALVAAIADGRVVAQSGV